MNAFAAGLARLTRDGELRDQLGKEGFEFVHSNYSKERLLTDIRKLYSDLLQRSSEALEASAANRGVHSRVY